MEFLKLAHERYSCRSLSSAPVEEEKIDRILEAALAAPTAKNQQPFRIWVLRSAEAKAAAAEAAKFPFVKQAPVIFVIGSVADEAFVRKFDGKNYADIDAAIVATHMMLEVKDLGLGTTWVGFMDPEKLYEAVPDMRGKELVALFAVGYPAADAVPAERHFLSREKDELVRML